MTVWGKIIIGDSRNMAELANESIGLVSLGWGREGRSPLKALNLRGDRSPAPGLVL